jgi:hypothetical protein
MPPQMTSKKPRGAEALPLMMTQLALSSFETVLRRSWLIASGTCSYAEYQRMLLEKVEAAGHSAKAVARVPDAGYLVQIVSPWHAGATANAKRLRRR